jgi:hypothetical protein
MNRLFKSTIAALSVACLSVPALAQGEPEEARTTYQVTFLKFAPGADDRWTEMMDKYYIPTAAAAGERATQVHWLMDGEWDIMLVREMPRGMAMIDSHNPPERTAYEKAFLKTAGSEAMAKKLNEESDQLIASSMRFYTHTHP